MKSLVHRKHFSSCTRGCAHLIICHPPPRHQRDRALARTRYFPTRKVKSLITRCKNQQRTPARPIGAAPSLDTRRGSRAATDMGASASRRRDDILATKDGPGRSSAASESRISRLGLPVNPRPPTSRASFASHGLTHIGGKRENQDEVLVDDRFMGDPDMKLYCVFDGHGQHGAAAARFARDFLPTQLAFELEKSAAASRAARLTVDAARLDSDERRPRMFGERQFGAIALASLVEVDPEIVSQSLVSAFTVTDAEMRYEPWECALSGTTAIVALVIRDVMYVAHAGDSRAIVVFDALDDDPAPRLLERMGRFFNPVGLDATRAQTPSQTTIARDGRRRDGRRAVLAVPKASRGGAAHVRPSPRGRTRASGDRGRKSHRAMGRNPRRRQGGPRAAVPERRAASGHPHLALAGRRGGVVRRVFRRAGGDAERGEEGGSRAHLGQRRGVGRG